MTAFKYHQRCPSGNQHQSYITSVTFPISRYGKVTREMKFAENEKQTEDQAIKRVEHFLSQPVTREYFDAIKDDLFNRNLRFEDLAKYDFRCRGDLLTDCVFLEGIDRVSAGAVVFRCDT